MRRARQRPGVVGADGTFCLTGYCGIDDSAEPGMAEPGMAGSPVSAVSSDGTEAAVCGVRGVHRDRPAATGGV